jgi:hypothetical protein
MAECGGLGNGGRVGNQCGQRERYGRGLGDGSSLGIEYQQFAGGGLGNRCGLGNEQSVLSLGQRLRGPVGPSRVIGNVSECGLWTENKPSFKFFEPFHLLGHKMWGGQSWLQPPFRRPAAGLPILRGHKMWGGQSWPQAAFQAACRPSPNPVQKTAAELYQDSESMSMARSGYSHKMKTRESPNPSRRHPPPIDTYRRS